MLESGELGRIKPSVAELQIRQRWRGTVLWVVRGLMLVFLLLVLKTVLVWPMRDLDGALDTCMKSQSEDARLCMRREIELRRIPIEQARMNLMAFVFLTLTAFGVALWIRFGLRQQLRQSSRFADYVFDSVPLPLSLRTPSGMILNVNTAFEKRYGVGRRNMTGRQLAEFIPAETARDLAHFDQLAIQSKEPIQTEFTVTRGEKTEHFILHLQSVRDDDGAVLGLVTARQDVTALRAHEAELTLANDKLRRLSAQMIDAQEAERRRIARDLHDQVGQILTALKMQIAMVAKQGAVADAASALMLAREFAEEALRHTRDLSASLHPHLLDDLGLEAALNWLIDRFVRPLVPTVDLRCRIAPARSSQEAELVAFRVVQEALTNAARHAQATRIGVIVESTDGVLAIEVIDDGVGFEGGNAGLEAKRGTSLGLAGMGDRVAEFGGELAMDSTPGVGTRLRARLPWTAKQVTA
jgi:PAS domain S-box-containing protein